MKADIIIQGNAVFDSVGEKPFQGFVAVKGNKILKWARPMAQRNSSVKVQE